MKFNLQHVDIRSTLIPAFFQTPYARAEVIKEANEGLKDIERAIVTILDQEISPYAIKLDDVAELIGTSGKKMKTHIKAAQKIARDKYDGTYDPPEFVEVEKLIYFMTAMIIAECGRISDNLTEYTVRFFMDQIFNLSALDTANDFACWAFFIEYFEYCLDNEEVSVSAFLKSRGNSMVSRSKLNTFIKKNDWYNDPKLYREVFSEDCAAPSVAEVAKHGIKAFEAIRRNIDERNFF